MALPLTKLMAGSDVSGESITAQQIAEQAKEDEPQCALLTDIKGEFLT